MKKVSFSVTSKSNPKPKQHVTSDRSPQINRESITEFDPTQTQTQTLESAPRKHIIPPKQNEWRPSKKMKNLDLPPLHSDGKPLEFEFESSDITKPEPDSYISFGLNLRQDSINDNNNRKEEGPNTNNIDLIMVKKLKSDMEKLPDEVGFDQFDEVPVDGFGEALLGGYGWKKGMGIGRNAKEDVKVVEYKRRTAKEGLGFMDTDKVVLPNDNKKSKFEVGKEVRIVDGRRMVGLKGRVVEVLPGGESVVLRLSQSEEEVKVSKKDIAELGSFEEDKYVEDLKKLENREEEEEEKKEEKVGKSRGGSVKKSEGSKRERKEESKRGRTGRGNGVSWLRSHIRVRVVSQSFKRGKFYLKKGVVIDAFGTRTCDLSMDDGREIVQGVEQEMLETALPRRGGPVIVLFGKHKGAYGSLVERDSKRETAVVQDADSREMLHVQLDQIAEYVGDPGDIGY